MTSKIKYSQDNSEGNPLTYMSETQALDNQFVNYTPHHLINVPGNLSA